MEYYSAQSSAMPLLLTSRFYSWEIYHKGWSITAHTNCNCSSEALCAGPARKKVQRTTYNEKGEEVTEMVYEDAKPETAAAPATEKVSFSHT